MVYMLLTPHAAVGIAIGSAIPDPRIAIPLSFLSHFILDAIPHWDDIGIELVRGKFPKISNSALRFIFIDSLVALVLTLVFVYWSLPDVGVSVTIALSAFAAILPDIYYVPLAFLNKRWGWVMWMVDFQSRIQKNSKAPRGVGLLIQAVIIVVCLLIALRQIPTQLSQI